MSTITTFSQLDNKTGSKTQGDSSLDAWYASVKDKPLGDLTIDDLGRAMRQGIHLSYVIPVVLQTLDSDPLAGYQCDGELISVMARMRPDFWKQHPDLANRAADCMKRARYALDEDVLKEVDAFLVACIPTNGK